jgi:hypothetical protein
VNPRYLRGPGIVADRYGLIEEIERTWAITAAGQDLLSAEFGATERGIDLQEGMGELLKLLQVKPNARRGDLLPGWRDFVVGHSTFGRSRSSSTSSTTGSRASWTAS